MKMPRDLTGAELTKALRSMGYVVTRLVQVRISVFFAFLSLLKSFPIYSTIVRIFGDVT